ncbi:Gfo/Idh/MocA family protein [Chloroflexota bacterium]
MKIGWGIIGIGTQADGNMAPAIIKAADTKLVAVCSRSLERANSFATRHGAERAYNSLEKMLEDPELNVLYVATPNSLHAEQTIQAAEAGKHVLCEKPMALTLADSELMIQACNRNKVKLGVFYQHRYHPAHIEARHYIQSVIVGDITLAKVQYCRRLQSWRGWRADPSIAGAGSLMGLGVHCIDLLRYLLDSEVTEVRAMTDEEPPQRPVDEMVYAMLKFENGAYGTMISGIRAPHSDNDVVLYGSKANVTCKGTVGKPMGNLGELLVDNDSLSVKMTFPTDELSLAQIRTVEAFNKWIEDNTEPHISGYNGLQMVRVTNAIIESSRQGKAVKIIE